MSNENTKDQVAYALERMKDDNGYFTYGTIAWDALKPAQREQLKQLVYQGPVWDGCVISKSDRDALIKYGLAVRCCFVGEHGYTAATYLVGTVVEQGKGEPFQRKPGTRG